MMQSYTPLFLLSVFAKKVKWPIAFATMLIFTSNTVIAEAYYVYHEATTNNPGCGFGYPNFRSVQTPTSSESMTIAWKVEWENYTNQTRIYYTVDGSIPSGAFGIAIGTTQVLNGTWNCKFGTPFVDVWTATIPAQAAGKTVKYIVSAWHSGGGDEIFANGGGSPCTLCGSPTNNSSLATVFEYTVLNANNVEVSASSGTTIGSYPTLKGAFDKINDGTHKGVIAISIYGNTSESLTASLNASGTGLASYTSIGIQPAGGAARTISGTSDAASLINFNGADNITVDGLNTGGNSLTISNLSISSVAGTSTIKFTQDASSNTLTNCTILGATTATIDKAAGTILFSVGSATGNDNNTISFNNIGDVGSSPSMAITSSGTSTAISNDNNTVNGNNIYNWYATTITSAINISLNSSAWNISSNKFYQTTSRSGLGSGNYLKCVYINTAAGSGYTINNNIMGYSNSNSTGMLTNSGGRFTGIEISVAASPVSNIQGNTINNINWTTTSGATSPGATPFNGIIVSPGGGVNIGSTSGNTIGTTTGTGSSTGGIYITGTTSGMAIIPFYVNSSTSCQIQNNNIGAITTGGTAAIGYKFYGIYISGTGSHTITSNTIGNATANNIAIGTSGITTAANSVYGIYTTANGTTETIGNTSGTGNTIQNLSSFGSNTASLFYGIYNTNAAGTLNANYNTFTANSLVGGSASSPFSYANIYNSGAITTALNINNNTVNSAIISSSTFDGYCGFIISDNGGVTSSVSIQNNTFTGFLFTGVSDATAFFYGIYHNAPSKVGSKNISNNSFNNLTLKTSGQVILVFTNDLTQTMTVSGNSIGIQFTRTVSSDYDLYGIYSANATGVSSGTHTISNNNFSNITTNTTALATTGIVGILWQPGASATPAPTVIISGNTIINHTNTGTAPSTGIIGDYSTNLTISGNTIGDLATAGATNTGIESIELGATVNIFKNKIYNLSTTNASGSNRGINLGSSVSTTTLSCNVYNNIIGGLTAPNASGPYPVTGIWIDGGATNTYNLYYNTINLNTTSSGAIFGSAALYSYTTHKVNLRNNIFVNTSVPKGATGYTTAYRRSGTTLNTYLTTSNNNLFYAGTPGTKNLLLYDGTNSYQTLSSYKTAVAPADASSISESPNWVSTTGANSNYLHINPAIPTGIESGGANISTYTDDFDGNIREGNAGYIGTGSAPDIGADEFESTCAGAIGGTAIGAVTFCASGSPSITASGYSFGSGSTYLWQYSNDNFTIDIHDFAGQTNPATLTMGIVSATTYYRLKVTCTSGTATDYSNIVVITVRPTPAATISGTTGVCQNAATPLVTFTNPQPLPVTVTYNINGATQTTINIGASTTATVAQSTTTSGAYVYNLESVVYQTSPTCLSTINGIATITVNPKPTTSPIYHQ